MHLLVAGLVKKAYEFSRHAYMEKSTSIPVLAATRPMKK